jgi:cytidine kinase
MLSRLMSLVVVGSIAFDTVKTPFGERERMLGGSAVHFSLAASFFTDVRMVGPVGDDFGDEEYAVLRARGVNTDDIERVPGGKTFFWAGEYEYNLNVRHTLETQLNVFGDFQPKLSEGSKQADVLFLANIQPDLQREVREQCTGARLAGLDSMNLWIDTARDSLMRSIGLVDLIFLNDAEIRQLTEEPNLVRAARKVMEMGPRVVIAKQGEYGAALFTRDRFFSIPAYPLETVRDPTGAGDSFAGGFMGYLSSVGPEAANDDDELRRAMTYGSVLASFNVEDFGTERVRSVTRDEIDERLRDFRRITHFEVEPATTS